jgi:hypothetical protein
MPVLGRLSATDTPEDDPVEMKEMLET